MNVLEAIRRDITLEAIIVAVIMYIIVRTIVRIGRYFERKLERGVGHFINLHVKNGHKTRFKHCHEDSCATVVPGIVEVQHHQMLESVG